ncbi:MAG: AAC(3) family N-acetyltransferase [Candidatus Krumholzibacteriia bacterium]
MNKKGLESPRDASNAGIHLVKRFLPAPVRTQLRSLRRSIKRMKVRRSRQITSSELASDLNEIGLGSGEIVLVHSALSKIGFVVGGADAVIDSFLEVLGPAGTLLMPSFPFDTYVEDYLEANRFFDAANTPSRMGKITEVFRLRAGVVRSVHPTHPVAALGPEAEYLTSGHRQDSETFGPNSPFHRLCEKDGRILLVGVDFHAMTNLHVVEDVFPRFPYQVYAPKTIAVRVREHDGRQSEMTVRAHSRSLSHLRDCNKMEKYFLEAGVLKIGRIGDAEGRLMQARGVLEVMRELAARGITMYFDDRVPAEKRNQKTAS